VPLSDPIVWHQGKGKQIERKDVRPFGDEDCSGPLLSHLPIPTIDDSVTLLVPPVAHRIGA
jgi:hypothetical protein